MQAVEHVDVRPDQEARHSRSTSRARAAGRREREAGGARAATASEPSSRQAPKRGDEHSDLAARESLLASPMTTTASSTPGPMKFASPKSSAHVRRNGRPQRKRKPSASRVRSDAWCGSRSSWNGVRIASSERVENAYETASTRNGQRAGDPEERAAERRRRRAAPLPRVRVSTAAAAGSWCVGTTARSAPGRAAVNSAVPLPSTNATTTICQKATRSSKIVAARLPIASDAHAVGGDHQPLAVPAVGCKPGGQREERRTGLSVRTRRSRPSPASPSPRARAADRRSSSTRAERRQQLPGLQQHEVAVPAQRDRGHSVPFSPWLARAKGTTAFSSGNASVARFVYQVADAFRYAANCHCSRCRAATGSAFKPFAGIERGKLEVTEGQDLLLVVGEQNSNDTRCGACGSLLFSVVRDGAYVHVAMGSLVDVPSHQADVAYLRRLQGTVVRDHGRPASTRRARLAVIPLGHRIRRLLNPRSSVGVSR